MKENLVSGQTFRACKHFEVEHLASNLCIITIMTKNILFLILKPTSYKIRNKINKNITKIIIVYLRKINLTSCSRLTPKSFNIEFIIKCMWLSSKQKRKAKKVYSHTQLFQDCLGTHLTLKRFLWNKFFLPHRSKNL